MLHTEHRWMQKNKESRHQRPPKAAITLWLLSILDKIYCRGSWKNPKKIVGDELWLMVWGFSVREANRLPFMFSQLKKTYQELPEIFQLFILFFIFCQVTQFSPLLFFSRLWLILSATGYFAFGLFLDQNCC